MRSVLLVRLGTGEYAEGRRTMYAAFEDELVLEVISATNDDEALAKARELVPDGVVACEPALAELARRRRAPVRPELTAMEKIRKAHVAARLFEKDNYRAVTAIEPLMDFFEAGCAFERALQNDSREQWHIGAKLRGTIADRSFDRELFFLVVPGDEPSFIILSQSDARWVFEHDADVTEVDRMDVAFRKQPGELSTILGEVYGLATVPHVTVVDGRTRRTPDNIDFEYLAGCLATIVRHVKANAPGIFYKPLLGGELDINLMTFEE